MFWRKRVKTAAKLYTSLTPHHIFPPLFLLYL